MKTTLVLTDEIDRKLITIAANPLETAGVLIAKLIRDVKGNIRLLAREFIDVPDHAYIRREADSLGISSDGYVHALARAEEHQCVPIWVHTHPGIGAIPTSSIHDKRVDEQIADLFRLRSNSKYYGALIVSSGGVGITFTGFLLPGDDDMTLFDRIIVAGDRFRFYGTFDSQPPDIASAFDRNVRAFGRAMQNTLGELRIGIVGCGGIGSAVGEQLARLGVLDYVLIDPDTLSETNTTRVYGSFPEDVGRQKVDVLAEHIEHINPSAQCDRLAGMITVEKVARSLIGCDIVFGCTDDNAGRLILSRLTAYYLLPVIDSGVLLTSNDQDTLTGIDGRVTTLIPGQACLLCRGRIDIQRASSELMTPEEHNQREREGYAPALGRTEPAVVAYTTFVAATAVGELLERFVGYGPEPRPSEVLLRCHDRAISTNIALPRDGHYCHTDSGKIGSAAEEPFLDIAWTA